MEKKKILVVEDHQVLNETIVKRLSDLGFDVSGAPDGLEAFNMIRKNPPDLVISDVMMPKMDGLALCRMIKFDEKYQSIPIILLTARDQDKDMQLGEEVKADRYLVKPLDFKLLIEEVKKFLSVENS